MAFHQVGGLCCIIILLLSTAQACVHHLQRSVSAEEIHAQSLDYKRSLPYTLLPKTAINNVRVWDGTCFTRPQTVIIENGLISDCSEDVEKTVDSTGQYLIPGLMDAHIHINDLDGLKNVTSYGVTTAFNMACANYEACNALRDQPGLATFLSAGIPAIGAGSHHAQIFPVNPSSLIHPNTSIPNLVDWSFGNGSDYYKIISEHKGPTPQQQDELVKTAHQIGQLAVTHAANIAAFLDGVASKTDGLQHVPPEALLSHDTIKTAKTQKQFATVTMEIFRQAFTNPAVLGFLRGNASDAGWSWENVKQNVRALHKAGVPILAGTDAVGALPGTDVYIPFGSTLHQELENLVSVGLTPSEALRAATIEPAMKFGLHNRGAIAVGNRADLVLLNADPMVNISNTRSIARVWAAGVEVGYVNGL